MRRSRIRTGIFLLVPALVGFLCAPPNALRPAFLEEGGPERRLGVSLGESTDPDGSNVPNDFLEVPGPQGEEIAEDSQAVVIAYNFDQLKNALKNDVTTTIYLGADIAVESIDVAIGSGKPWLVIDGINPEQPEDGIHSLTDFHASNYDQTIRVTSDAGPKRVEARNLKVKGKNYYGFICIYDNAKDVDITYDNVYYEGPQMVYNRYGTTRIRDCTVNIGRYGGASDPNEVGEVADLVLEGEVNLTQMDSQNNEFFYFATKPGTLTVGANANVTVTTPWDAGFVNTAHKVSMVLEENATFTYRGANRFWDGTALAKLTLRPRSRMDVTVDNLSIAMLQINGDIFVDEEAVLRLEHLGNAVQPLMGPNPGDAVFTGPGQVLLYNINDRAIRFGSAPGVLEIQAQQINYWNTAGPGGFSDPPLHAWWKTTEELFQIKGTVTNGAAGNIGTVTTNYDPADTPWPVAPDSASFNLSTSPVLAFGALELDAWYTGGATPSVGGYTGSDADIRLLFTDGEGVSHTLDDRANGEGFFSVPLNASLPAETEIGVYAHREYLYRQTTVSAGEQDLAFDPPPGRLSFETTPLSTREEMIPRVEPDWGFAVRDNLGEGEQWQVTATLLSPFTTLGAWEEDTLLENILIFVDGEEEQTLSADRPVLIHRHTASLQPETTRLSWAEDQGLLLRVPPGKALSNRVYTATILWSLELVP